MRKRSLWVEPLFGEAKEFHRLRRFRLRRLPKVNIEGVMVAAGQNLKRLIKHHLYLLFSLSQIHLFEVKSFPTSDFFNSLRHYATNRVELNLSRLKRCRPGAVARIKLFPKEHKAQCSGALHKKLIQLRN